MRIGKDDWAFKVNGKNGNLAMELPKRTSYSAEEFKMVALGLMRFCAPIGMLFDGMLKQAAREAKRKSKK